MIALHEVVYMKMSSKYWMVLAAACGLAASSVGICFNTNGLFYTPISADFGVGRGSVAMISTIFTITSALMGMFTPRLIKPKTLKPILLAATVMMVGASALMSLCNSLFPLYLLCTVRGLGCGMCNFVTVTMLINNWFRKSHGVFTSIAMTFSGVPALVLSSLFTSVIQNHGWRTGFLAVAAAILICNLPAVLFPYTLRPEDSGMKAYGQEEYEQYKKENPTHVMRGSAPHFSYLSADFALAAGFTILVCIAFQVTQHFPAFAESKGFDSQFGALLLSVAMAGSVSCKLIYGSVADKLGNSKAMIITAFLSLISNFILLFSGSALSLEVGAFLNTVTAANSSVGIALIASDLFGAQNYSKAYPTISFMGSMVGAVSGTMIGYMYDLTGSYNAVLVTLAVIQALIILVVITAYRKKAAVKTA